MRVRVLGTTEAELDVGPVDLRTRKQRAMLAGLTLYHSSPVSPDRLVDLVWGGNPPTAVSATLQAYIARLRRDLEPWRAARAPSSVVLTGPAGYTLAIRREDIDAARFHDAVTKTHAKLVGDLTNTGTHVIAREALEEMTDHLSQALGWWRGTPYAELDDTPAAAAERARLEDLRLVALEDRAVVELALGRQATLAAELEALTSAHPLRERLWALRATALARSGRQADALEVLRKVREILNDELGLEPGQELRALQEALLRQDSRLGWTLASPSLAAQPKARSQAPARPIRSSDPWPIIGRDSELDVAFELLEAARHRGPRFAVVTGEAGIGKSRLGGALLARAQAVGVRTLVGRCSQDEGAPPLWPWAAVLGELGLDLPSGIDGDAARGQFDAWQDIEAAIRNAAQNSPVLLLLEDLHWADASTLRVLNLLAETLKDDPILVMVTWRATSLPSAPLAATAEKLDRRHAVRLELEGLGHADAAALALEMTGQRLSAAQSDELCRLTDGNPFYLVEYLRLSVDTERPATPGSPQALPPAVRNVLSRRLAELSEPVLLVVEVGSVLGREFDLAALAAVTGRGEEEVLSDLELGVAAGVLVEEGVDKFRFTHALLRDAAYAGVSMSRRARLHALAGSTLEGRPQREGEVAWHWAAAGDRYARRAWRSAVVAADWARQLYAHDEAAALLQQAVSAIKLDPEATAADRHDLWMALCQVLQLADRWSELRPAIHQAVTMAREVDDVDRIVAAATLPLTGALWQAAGHGFVDGLVVGTLRDLLVRLPTSDSPARCRVMLSLAGELYYGSTALEREALVDEAVAMARRLGDPHLLAWACVTGSTATYRPSTAQQRLDLLEEGIEAAQRSGDRQTLSSAMTLRAAVLMELGRVAEMQAAVMRARSLAVAEHHYFAQFVLHHVELPWSAMRGEAAEVDRMIDELVALGEQVRIPSQTEAQATVELIRSLWLDDADALVDALRSVEAVTPLPITAFATAMLVRAGHRDEARSRLGHDALQLGYDVWFSALLWASAAEVAFHFDRPALAADTYRLLAPLAGGTAHTSSISLGPIDAFLAMAAAAVGDVALATRHADDTMRLCERWRIPLVAAWFAEIRDEGGF